MEDQNNEKITIQPILNPSSKKSLRKVQFFNSGAQTQRDLPPIPLKQGPVLLSDSLRLEGDERNRPNLRNIFKSSKETSDLPQILKNSLEKKNESLASLNLSIAFKYTDYCELATVKEYLNNLRQNLKLNGRTIKYLGFDGIEAITDTVFYIFYKYFNDVSLWSELERVSIDSCRYLTDFGVELLSRATFKSNLINKKTSTGCNRIFSSFYINESNDVFQSDLFTKLNISDEKNKRVDLNIFKVLILNETKFNTSKFIQSKIVEYKTPIVNFADVVLKRSGENDSEKIKFNLVEINSVGFCSMEIFNEI